MPIHRLFVSLRSRFVKAACIGKSIPLSGGNQIVGNQTPIMVEAPRQVLLLQDALHVERIPYLFHRMDIVLDMADHLLGGVLLDFDLFFYITAFADDFAGAVRTI